MARQTPREKLSPLAKRYYEKYVRFSEQLHHGWVHFQLQAEVQRLLEFHCHDEDYQQQVRIDFESPVNPERRQRSRLRGKNLPGLVERLSRREIPEGVFLNALGLFEAFVCDIAKEAYMALPDRFLRPKLLGGKAPGAATERENEKLLVMLLESTTREEALERYVEERLRGVFYGNPTEVFTKDKLRLGIAEDMKKYCATEMELYGEAVARRNVLVHNMGRVDRKYLREVPNSNLKCEERVQIDSTYLFEVLRTLNELAKRYVAFLGLSTTSNELPQVRTGNLRTRRNIPRP